MLGIIKVHAGDFKTGNEHQFIKNFFLLKTKNKFFREKISVDKIEKIEIANEENVKRLTGMIGMGVVGAVLLGPVGLLVGILAGGHGKTITFICEFKDGRKFLGSTPYKVYQDMTANIYLKGTNGI